MQLDAFVYLRGSACWTQSWAACITRSWISDVISGLQAEERFIDVLAYDVNVNYCWIRAVKV